MHANEALARHLWLAMAEGAAEPIHRHVDRKLLWRTIGTNPLSGQFRGVDGLFDYFSRVAELADDLRTTLQGVFANDEGAVLAYHTSARRGVKRLEMDYLLLLRIRGHKVISGLVVPVDQRENDRFWT